MVDLHVVRDDGAVWNAGWRQAGVNDNQWNPGYPVSAETAVHNPLGKLAAISPRPDRTDLFLVARGGQVYTAWWDITARE